MSPAVCVSHVVDQDIVSSISESTGERKVRSASGQDAPRTMVRVGGKSLLRMRASIRIASGAARRVMLRITSCLVVKAARMTRLTSYLYATNATERSTQLAGSTSGGVHGIGASKSLRLSLIHI